MEQIQSNSSKAEQIRKMRDRTEPVDRQQEYWTDDELQRLETMFYEGVGITEIAIDFSRTELAIVTQLNAMGLFKRSRASRRKEPECLCPKCERYPDCAKCRERMLLVSTSNS